MKEMTDFWVRNIVLQKPTLQDNTADVDRLTSALQTELGTDTIDIDLSLLKKIPELLRKWNYHIKCVLFKNRKRWTLTGIRDALDTSPVAGMAVDLGTSRVVLRLIDISTGKIMTEASFDNPQLTVGPDILTRIHFTEQEQGLERLNRLIVDGLNDAIEKACTSCGISADDVYLFAVAGNTTMTHLFMGINPRWINREPYIPAVNRPGLIKARDLGINANSEAGVFIFPNIGSYFGGDLIAGILYSGLNRQEETSILVDVGTNAEVVLGNRDWLMACAGAAGPALEGGVAKMGMMAGPGVIDRISIDPASYAFELHTIEDIQPLGICGSGVIDLAAHLFLSGLIDIRGKLQPSVFPSRIREKDGLMQLTIVPGKDSATGSELYFSQADLDSLIRSKAAMYTILETITSSVGMQLKDLSKFYVAGMFGAFINPESAITIGMLPDLSIECFESIGNSSLGGAALALTSCNCLEEIDEIRDSITYLELNVNQDFMNRFSAAKFIPHTNRSLFPSVKV